MLEIWSKVFSNLGKSGEKIRIFASFSQGKEKKICRDECELDSYVDRQGKRSVYCGGWCLCICEWCVCGGEYMCVHDVCDGGGGVCVCTEKNSSQTFQCVIMVVDKLLV